MTKIYKVLKISREPSIIPYTYKFYIILQYKNVYKLLLHPSLYERIVKGYIFEGDMVKIVSVENGEVRVEVVDWVWENEFARSNNKKNTQCIESKKEEIVILEVKEAIDNENEAVENIKEVSLLNNTDKEHGQKDSKSIKINEAGKTIKIIENTKSDNKCDDTENTGLTATQIAIEAIKKAKLHKVFGTKKPGKSAVTKTIEPINMTEKESEKETHIDAELERLKEQETSTVYVLKPKHYKSVVLEPSFALPFLSDTPALVPVPHEKHISNHLILFKSRLLVFKKLNKYPFYFFVITKDNKKIFFFRKNALMFSGLKQNDEIYIDKLRKCKWDNDICESNMFDGELYQIYDDSIVKRCKDDAKYKIRPINVRMNKSSEELSNPEPLNNKDMETDKSAKSLEEPQTMLDDKTTERNIRLDTANNAKPVNDKIAEPTSNEEQNKGDTSAVVNNDRITEQKTTSKDETIQKSTTGDLYGANNSKPGNLEQKEIEHNKLRLKDEENMTKLHERAAAKTKHDQKNMAKEGAKYEQGSQEKLTNTHVTVKKLHSDSTNEYKELTADQTEVTNTKSYTDDECRSSSIANYITTPFRNVKGRISYISLLLRKRKVVNNYLKHNGSVLEYFNIRIEYEDDDFPSKNQNYTKNSLSRMTRNRSKQSSFSGSEFTSRVADLPAYRLQNKYAKIAQKTYCIVLINNGQPEFEKLEVGQRIEIKNLWVMKRGDLMFYTSSVYTSFTIKEGSAANRNVLGFLPDNFDNIDKINTEIVVEYDHEVCNDIVKNRHETDDYEPKDAWILTKKTADYIKTKNAIPFDQPIRTTITELLQIKENLLINETHKFVTFAKLISFDLSNFEEDFYTERKEILIFGNQKEETGVLTVNYTNDLDCLVFKNSFVNESKKSMFGRIGANTMYERIGNHAIFFIDAMRVSELEVIFCVTKIIDR